MTGNTSEQPSLQRIGLFGGTGFVGSYLVDALLASDFHPVLLVRDGSEARVRQLSRCTIVNGDIDDADAIERVVEASDALIYNIGILREFPKRGVTFAKLQDDAARRVMDAAVGAGVSRFLLMSANGVKPDGTAYQRTKYNAEAHLQDTDLDWTIFRPSVLFGDPRGHMEFATQLSAEIIDSPLPAPLFHSGLLPFNAGRFLMSPVHVTDVAAKRFRLPETRFECCWRAMPAPRTIWLNWASSQSTFPSRRWLISMHPCAIPSRLEPMTRLA